MSDPQRKPISGEPFVPSARQFGQFIDTVRRVDELARNQQSRRGDAYDPTRVWISNETGGNLVGARPIVGLGEPLLPPSSPRALERPTFRGIFSEDADRFAVLQGPLRAGSIAPAVVAGVTWVRLLVTSETEHIEQAAPDSATRLRLIDTGSAFVLWREGGNGEQWALVRLGQPATPRLEGLLVSALEAPSCALASPTTGTLRVHRRDPDTHTLLPTPRTITVHNSDPDLSGETNYYAKVEWLNGVWSVYWLGCTDATEGCASSSDGSSGSGPIRP